MNFEVLYLVCFCFGLILTVLAFASGMGHMSFGHFGHFHLGSGHGMHGHPHGGMPALNAFTVLVFLCWFGGVGYLLERGHSFGTTTILGLAILGGLCAASLVFGFMVKVLLPHERLLLPEDTEMRGVIGTISSSIYAGGTGEILFSQNGTRRCAAARIESGGALARGQQVLVLRYERGVAWVRPWTELDDMEALVTAPH